jgi:predicted 3-demethylubiquinone-9 3-methyltransferase (glyoxalase superfamily)
MTSQPFTTCLWFDDQGEEAARFYASVFKDSSIDAVHRYTEVGPGPDGKVMTVEFTLNGHKFLALNGGPQYKATPATSTMVYCADQAEIDYYWERLTEGGQGIACGWLTDRFGFSWQVVPSVFFTLVSDPDREKGNRVMSAMMQMVKFDIAALERAYAGE